MRAISIVLCSVASFGLVLCTFALGFTIGSTDAHKPRDYPTYRDGGPSPPLSNDARWVFKQPCRSPSSRDESELCAQYQAADAAHRAARWAKWQFWINLFGLAGLFGTIILTLKAVRTATKSNEISDKTAKRELRAYITLAVERVTITAGARPKILLTIMNYGHTPASGCAVRVRGIVGQPGDDFALDDFKESERPDTTYHPSGKMKFTILGDTAISPQDEIDLKSGAKILFIIGDLHYIDAFEHKQKTTLSAEFSGADCFATKQPRFARFGNTAT